MEKISKNKINYCKEGNFFWVRWKESPNDSYEHILAKPLYEQIVHGLGKQGFEVVWKNTICCVQALGHNSR